MGRQSSRLLWRVSRLHSLASGAGKRFFLCSGYMCHVSARAIDMFDCSPRIRYFHEGSLFESCLKIYTISIMKFFPMPVCNDTSCICDTRVHDAYFDAHFGHGQWTMLSQE